LKSSLPKHTVKNHVNQNDLNCTFERNDLSLPEAICSYAKLFNKLAYIQA